MKGSASGSSRSSDSRGLAFRCKGKSGHVVEVWHDHQSLWLMDKRDRRFSVYPAMGKTFSSCRHYIVRSYL